MYVPVPVTLTPGVVNVATGVVHAVVLNTWKVIVPVGVVPPTSVAVSWIAVPTVTGPLAWVVSVGVDVAGALVLTTTDSCAPPQPSVTAVLFVSPE